MTYTDIITIEPGKRGGKPCIRGMRITVCDVLEYLAVEAYLEGSISVGKVRELLGMTTRLEVDAFLKEKGVDLQYDETDFENDRQIHDQLRKEGKLRL